ncbi:Hypothetical predicted protein [Cloeon dipterum]|uniref:F-box domain-containing protein n=1 Tax=Cloeon dipterum TaxID=197152 RepID=A0A8S1E150_9INSE|nr:Hypothetical predicted protein [Cloeon dipterum]
MDSEQIVDLKLSFTKYLTGLERVESMVDGDSDSSLCNYLNWRDDLELPMEVSQLRYLHAHATENQLFHTRFPHVTHLTVFPNPNYGDANNQPIDSLEHFSHLESLRLVCGLREEYLQRLLNRHGANLRSLIIEQVEDHIVDLNFISARCQLLEVLDISTKFTISSKYLFPELKKLSLRCIEFDFDDIKLSYLLNIPNLEDLRIRDISIHTFDLDDLRGDCANMISNPPVLRQLEYLEISVWEDELFEDEIELARQYFKALNPNLHRFVSLYYPR